MKLQQIKIGLSGVHPPVWRRLLISSAITLDKLHEVLQTVMGWENVHMHQFVEDGKTYSDAGFEQEGTFDERKVTLGHVLAEPGNRLVYEYDFGDGWQHELVCEEVVESNEKAPYTLCPDGARACPPEDSGGPDAYSELLRALKNPKHKDHAEMREWIGADFDPEAFNVEEVNRRLLQRPKRK